jgi:dihydroceramidase
MHLLTTPIVYRLLTFKASPQRTKLVGTILLILFTTVMVTHMVMDEFLLHATTFGLSIYVIATRALKIISQQVPDPAIKKTLRNISILGMGKSNSQYACRNIAKCVASIFCLWLFCLVNRRLGV